MSDRRYDIAVIGAGPAGSNFARLAAASGKRILLLDGQTGQTKKPCGGLLAPDAQTVLAEMNLTLPASVLVSPQIFSVKTVDVEKELIRYYPRRYLNMDRFAFDRWLLSLVPDTVTVCSGICSSIRREENGGFLLTVRHADGRKSSLSAGMLVGADGGNSLVRRVFFGGYRGKKAIKRYIAIQQWFSEADTYGENPFYSCIFDRETSPSCSWSAYKDGKLLFGGMFEAANCRQAFEKQKERLSRTSSFRFRFGEPLSTEACMVCRPRFPRDLITGENGVYLIGEAAGFISPSSFEGISPALISSRALADALLSCPDAEQEAIGKQYRKNTRFLRHRLYRKCCKRIFMYQPFLRAAVLRSGFFAIRQT